MMNVTCRSVGIPPGLATIEIFNPSFLHKVTLVIPGFLNDSESVSKIANSMVFVCIIPGCKHRRNKDSPRSFHRNFT